MGNLCTGDDRPDLELDPDYTEAQRELLKFNMKDQPSKNYASLKGKPKAFQDVKQVVEQQLNKKRLRDPQIRGSKLPIYYVRGLKLFYDGQWKNGRPHGKGIAQHTNGTYFEGGFIDGQAECDDGILVYPDKSFYRGQFSDSKLNGQGQFNYEYNGLKYVGQWRNDKPQGNGQETFSDGSYYRGTFKDGLKDGRGIFNWKNGKRYEGEFKSGYMQGRGKLTKGKGYFDGTFKRNLKVEGTLVTQLGRYEGPFVNGQMHGQGRFIWNDKKVYEGQFYNGNLHGNGVITYHNGQQAKGVWEHGENKEIKQIENIK